MKIPLPFILYNIISPIPGFAGEFFWKIQKISPIMKNLLNVSEIFELVIDAAFMV